MSTLFSCIGAFWLTVITLAIGAATPSPWNNLTFTVPVVIVLAVVSSSDTAVRFAVFCGLFEAVIFPSQNPLTCLLLVLVALGSGALYRAMFSIPSTGALFVTTIIGSLMFEMGSVALNAQMYYEVGVPAISTMFIPALIRLMASMMTVQIGGSLYRNVVVRFRQAFVGNRTGI